MPRHIKIIITCIVVAILSIIMLTQEKGIIYFNSNTMKTSLIRVNTGDVVHIRCLFHNAGVSSNSSGQHGISAVLANIILRRLNDLSPFDTKRKLKELGIRSIDVNYEYDDFIVSFSLLKSNAKQALEFLSEAFKARNFSSDELQYAKQHLPYFSSIETSPAEELMSEKIYTMLFGLHNYGKNRSGTASDIVNISPAAIKAYMQTYFVKNNLELTLIGSLAGTDVHEYSNALTQHLHNGDRTPQATPAPPLVTSNCIEIINKTNMHDIAGISFGMRLDNPSKKEQAAALILMRALFDQDVGILIEGLNDQKLYLDLDCKMQQMKHAHVFTVTAFLPKEQIARFHEYTRESIKKYCTEIQLRNFDIAKLYFIKKARYRSTDLSDLQERNIHDLPFEKVTYHILQSVAQKLLTTIQTVVIGDNPPITQTADL